MRREKLFTSLWSCLLAFLVSFGSTACMVTAFNMEVSLWILAVWCAAAAVVCSLCYSLPLGPVPLGLGALMLGYLWQSGELVSGAEAILNRLSRQYHRAYNWEIIRWSTRVADEMEPTLVLWLCILGVLIAMGIAWAVCRRKTILPGAVLSVLCLGSCMVVTDTVPDVIWLYMLLMGQALLLLTHTVRRQNAAEGNRLTALVAGPVALVLLIVFVAVPQKSYSGQQTAKKLSDALMRLPMFSSLVPQETVRPVSAGDQVDLTTVGYRMDSKTPIMEVTADYDGVLYLRSRALDSYDGESWTASEDNDLKLSWPQDLEETGTVTVTTRYAHAMQYVPYYALHTDPDGTGTGIPNSQQLTQYTYSCSEMPSEMWLSKIEPQENFPEVIHMDEHVKAWAQPLAELLTENCNTTHEKARVIGNYVRRSATYSTATTRMPARKNDFAQWFLEDRDTGYCVHFASAATVLLQAAGIPARYVTGYVTRVQAGQTMVVEADKAHAWAEYYLPGFGWTVLEATPAESIIEPMPTQIQETTNPEGSDSSTLPSQPQTATQIQPGKQKNSRQIGATLLIAGLIGLGVILVLTGILVGQYSLRRHLYTKRCRASTPNQLAILYWQEVVRQARLLGKQPERTLFLLAQKAKFSRDTLTDEELKLFEEALLRTGSQLKRRSIFHRFFYRFILALY